MNPQPETEPVAPDDHGHWAATGAPDLSRDEQAVLLDLARRTLHDVVLRGCLPRAEAETMPPGLRRERGSFVTLTRHGTLRGCIGNVLPDGPLWRSVMANARAAATRDPRFSPVAAAELEGLQIEVSVLGETQSLSFRSPAELLSQLRPAVDGVVLRLASGSMATFLPQVWERLPDRERFLDTLAGKAGGAPGDWRQPGTTVLIYQVASFGDADPPAP
jgi:AmmeMemoRadiSam system protein A